MKKNGNQNIKMVNQIVKMVVMQLHENYGLTNEETLVLTIAVSSLNIIYVFGVSIFFNSSFVLSNTVV